MQIPKLKSYVKEKKAQVRAHGSGGDLDLPKAQSRSLNLVGLLIPRFVMLGAEMIKWTITHRL